MNSSLARVLILVALGACTAASRPSPVQAEETPNETAQGKAAKPARRPTQRPRKLREPSRLEVFRLLSSQRDLPLSGGRHCADLSFGVPAPTLGDWIAYNLAVLEAGRVRVVVKCAPPAGTPAQWTCDVTFGMEDGETTWDAGVRFGVNDADRTFVTGSLVCTGSA